MKIKTCTKCKTDKDVSLFEKVKGGVRNGKQRFTYSAQCTECKEEHSLFKVCGICKERLPKTEEYFNVKIIKQQNQNSYDTYYSFRYACRTCLTDKTAKIKKEYYHKNINISREKGREKYWRNPLAAQNNTKKWRAKNIESVRAKDRERVRHLDDSWVASQIGIPLKEIPIEILETRKIIIRLKRELKKQ
jgi:hypothetical protein